MLLKILETFSVPFNSSAITQGQYAKCQAGTWVRLGQEEGAETGKVRGGGALGHLDAAPGPLGGVGTEASRRRRRSPDSVPGGLLTWAPWGGGAGHWGECQRSRPGPSSSLGAGRRGSGHRPGGVAGARRRRFLRAASAREPSAPTRRRDSAPGGLPGGGMEDGGVLKEGFLVKRVSAPGPLRTLPREAGGGRAPAHPSGGPGASSTEARIGRLGLCRAQLRPVGTAGGRLAMEKGRGAGKNNPDSADRARRGLWSGYRS